MKYVSLHKNSVDKLRNDYIREHSKFIHSSYLLLEDLDKEVVIRGKKFTIAGLWDIVGYRKIILLRAENGTHAHLDSKEIAAALGFNTFRNFVTGKPITYDIESQTKYNAMLSKIKIEQEEASPMVAVVESDEDETEKTEEVDVLVLDRDDEYVPEEETEETEEDVDPLVKALREDEDFNDEY